MKKITKGYKAFEFDWTCKGKDYGGPGKTTTQKGELDICNNGIHACEKLEDVFKYYPLLPSYKFAEIEAYGEVKKSPEDSKFCAGKIKIIKELSFDEVVEKIKEESKKSNSTAVCGRNAVRWSTAVSDSTAVSNSTAVCGSNAVRWSTAVSDSTAVSNSTAVRWSTAVSDSTAVCGSTAVRWSTAVSDSTAVSNSTAVCGSNAVYNCYGVINCSGLANALFAADQKSPYTIFGKEVSEQRFVSVKNKIIELNKSWYPASTNTKELYLMVGSDWKKVPLYRIKEKTQAEMWADMPAETVAYIKSLPEFDAQIFKQITGK